MNKTKPELLMAHLAREGSKVIATYLFFNSMLMKREMCPFRVIIGSQAAYLSFIARMRRP